MSFVGTYNHTLDSKKRVFIPSKFRDELGDEFYITRKFHDYLSIYTAEDWEDYVDKISKLPEADAEELQDFVLGAAQKCVPEKLTYRRLYKLHESEVVLLEDHA